METILIGALIGAVVGGVVGYIYDRRKKRNKEK